MAKDNSKMIAYAIGIASAIIMLALIGYLLYIIANREKFESAPAATITYYFLPTCGWCTKFTPDWEAFEKKVKDEKVAIATKKVDGSTNAKEVEKYKIKGFPHIQIVKGDKVTVFEGERSVDNLMDFVKKNL